MCLSNALTGFWLDKKLNLSKHTITGYRVIFKRLIAFLDDPEFDQITTTDIRRFLAHLLDEYGLGHKSLSNAWIALSSLWTWAEIELGTPHVIRGKIKRPKFVAPVIEPLDRDDVEKLLDATEGKYARQGMVARNRSIILVLLDTGIRAQEFCDLTVGDYSQGRGRLHVRHGKGNKARFVPLGHRAQKSLWKYLATRPGAKPAEPLFATKTGNHMDRDNLRHLLDRLGQTAGVPGVYPHRFRHTYAIEFLRAGGNLLTLQAILGHETLEMVRRYARIVDRDVDAGAKNSPADNWKL